MIVESTENISINTEFSGINSTEFISLVENILIKHPNLKNDYLYSIEESEYIEIYKLELNVIGDIKNTNNLITDICKVDEIQISEINSYKEDENYETKLTLIASRGNYE